MPDKKTFDFQPFFFFAVPSLFFLFFPFETQAGIVPCGGTTDPCTICHLIIGIKNLIDWGSTILIALCILCFLIAGIMYIVSTGNSQMIETAKRFMTSTLIGFAVVLCAWVIVNTTMIIISTKEDLGIEKSCDAGAICWTQFTCSTASSTYEGGTSDEADKPQVLTGDCSPRPGATCGGLPGPSSGCEYTSSNLQSKLSCLNGKGVGARVTSVTLNRHADWCEKCVKTYSGDSYCAHTQSSCHFGGRQCKDPFASSAVDLNASEAVARAAVSCGFDTVIWRGKELISGKTASDHDDHVHASVDNAKCRCDYKK